MSELTTLFFFVRYADLLSGSYQAQLRSQEGVKRDMSALTEEEERELAELLEE